MAIETEIVYNIFRLDGKGITPTDEDNFKYFTKNQWEEKFTEFDKEYYISFGIIEYKVVKTIVPVERIIMNFIS